MDIGEFKRALTAFADEPSDVDVRLGKVVAQVRDDLIDVTIRYSLNESRELEVIENGQPYSARVWLINRVARLPQLADRIIASTSIPPALAAQSPFVVPSGSLSRDLSVTLDLNGEEHVPDAVAALLSKASNSLPGATSVLYVTSDAGEGKTTVINKAARLQAKHYKEKTASSLIVPIPLSGRAFLTFDDAVIAALVNKLRFNYLYFDAFVQLVRMGAIVPAFDGYEEMLVEGSRGEAVSALGNLVQSLDSTGTVFIAARKAFFEYLSFKTQAKLLDAIGDRSASFSRLELSRWTKDQFCEYGERRAADNPEEIYATVAARLGPEHPLLTRAVLVRRLFDVAAVGADRAKLTELLGSNPHDYFYTFVEAIVKREASEKWLFKVAGDVMEPLLDIQEHHQLLSQIAQEMWQSSTTSLRYDVLDVLVDLFAEGRKKSAVAIRQIKERLKQHSLLAADTSRGQALSFDHEDFQNFYLGEALGLLLSKLSRAELQAFLSVNLVPIATVEQAVQYLVRHKVDLNAVLGTISAINESETGFSFCKENCGAVAMRIAECIPSRDRTLLLSGMLFSTGALAGRTLFRVSFEGGHFQPTSISKSKLAEVEFKACEFERLEVDAGKQLVGCTFTGCRVESLLSTARDEQTFDPALISEWLRQSGARIGDDEAPAQQQVHAPDERTVLLGRFLRVFLRTTYVDEEYVRLRLGKGFASLFLDEVLPALLSSRVLEEVQWKGQGIQRRYRLLVPMSAVNQALERSRGSFDGFLLAIRS